LAEIEKSAVVKKERKEKLNGKRETILPKVTNVPCFHKNKLEDLDYILLAISLSKYIHCKKIALRKKLSLNDAV